MKRAVLTLLAIMFLSAAFAATEENIVLHTSTGDIHGLLLVPEQEAPCPVVLIIAGSGPTDMNGNTVGSNYNNNSLKMLAESLAQRGIASLRYDKRGIAKSASAGCKEEELSFEHYIDDAVAWIEKLNGDNRFNRIVVAGHSEGSLIGMIASHKSRFTDAYISIAGCGSPAYEVIEEQLAAQPEQVRREAAAINSELREGRTVEDVPGYLAALYRKSVQPYLISWFRYDPTKEIAKLKVPVLIIQGDKDIQVGVKEAEKLRMARILSSYYTIPDMNHVLKHCTSNDMVSQLETYRNPHLPVKEELIGHIVRFINNRQP